MRLLRDFGILDLDGDIRSFLQSARSDIELDRFVDSILKAWLQAPHPEVTYE
jgi:hypothetical protein